MKSFDEIYEILENMTAAGIFGTGAENSNIYDPANPVTRDSYATGDARPVFGFNKGRPEKRNKIETLTGKSKKSPKGKKKPSKSS